MNYSIFPSFFCWNKISILYIVHDFYYLPCLDFLLGKNKLFNNFLQGTNNSENLSREEDNNGKKQ